MPGRHRRFKRTEIGEIPEGWEVVELHQLARVKGGKRMPKGRPFATEPTPFPYLRVSDFSNGSVDDSNLCYVWPEDREKIKRYTISSSDLYISIAGTLGVVGQVPVHLDGAQLTENAAKICSIDDERIVPTYLRFFLSTEQALAQIHVRKGVGAGVPKLALFRIETIVVALPPVSEQHAITAILVAVESRARCESQALTELRRTKSALMSVLLTGEVRVTPDEQPA